MKNSVKLLFAVVLLISLAVAASKIYILVINRQPYPGTLILLIGEDSPRKFYVSHCCLSGEQLKFKGGISAIYVDKKNIDINNNLSSMRIFVMSKDILSQGKIKEFVDDKRVERIDINKQESGNFACNIYETVFVR